MSPKEVPSRLAVKETRKLRDRCDGIIEKFRAVQKTNADLYPDPFGTHLCVIRNHVAVRLKLKLHLHQDFGKGTFDPKINPACKELFAQIKQLCPEQKFVVVEDPKKL